MRNTKGPLVHTPMTVGDARGPRARPYYEALDRGCDHLLRCQDCGRLVRHAALVHRGATPCCGTRRVKEIRSLSLWEWLKIRLGLLDFDHRREFLREFARAK